MYFIIRNWWIYRLISPLTQNTCWPPEQARNWLDGVQLVFRMWSGFLLGAEGTWEQEKHTWMADRTSAHEMWYFGQLLVLTHIIFLTQTLHPVHRTSLYSSVSTGSFKGRPSWGKEEQKSVSQQKNHQRDLELPRCRSKRHWVLVCIILLFVCLPTFYDDDTIFYCI